MNESGKQLNIGSFVWDFSVHFEHTVPKNFQMYLPPWNDLFVVINSRSPAHRKNEMTFPKMNLMLMSSPDQVSIYKTVRGRVLSSKWSLVLITI